VSIKLQNFTIRSLTKRRFFQLLRDYKEDPDNFSIQYERKRATKKITDDVEKNIVNEGKEVFIQRIYGNAGERNAYISGFLQRQIPLLAIFYRARFSASIPHFKEKVYYHKMRADEKGFVRCALLNENIEEKGLEVYLSCGR